MMRPAHAFKPAPRLCLSCGANLGDNEDERTCSDACRMRVSRGRRRLVPLVRAVLMAERGLTPADPPPLWGLLRLLVRRERARVEAEQKASRLPGARR